jgi:putative Holliday junction resolvase
VTNEDGDTRETPNLRNVRIVALDVGDRRIGIAISDELGITVQGRPTRARTNPDEDVAYIRALVDENGACELVVGHPRNMDGTPSRQTRKTEEFVDRLREAIDVPVVLRDERLTSFAAEQRLEEMGLDWRKRRKHVDELAATLILEDYLADRLG